MELVDSTQQTQLIYLNGGGDLIISAKRSPIQQIDPMQQMKPIYIKGGGKKAGKSWPMQQIDPMQQISSSILLCV